MKNNLGKFVSKAVLAGSVMLTPTPTQAGENSVYMDSPGISRAEYTQVTIGESVEKALSETIDSKISIEDNKIWQTIFSLMGLGAVTVLCSIRKLPDYKDSGELMDNLIENDFRLVEEEIREIGDISREEYMPGIPYTDDECYNEFALRSKVLEESDDILLGNIGDNLEAKH